jgi:ferredoxin
VSKPVQAPSVRLHIDWTRCDGRGLCSELLPQVLGRDDWGYPLARDGSREPVIPGAAEPYASAAVHRCPRRALSLVADPPRPDRSGGSTAAARHRRGSSPPRLPYPPERLRE